MPSVSVSPAQLVWTPANASFTPERVTIGKASLVWTGGTVAFTAGNTGLSVTVPKLDRIMRQEKIVGQDDTASVRFQLIWQRFAEQIEAAFTALSTQVADNTALLAQIQAAQALAQAANDNATTVSQSVDISNSYTDPISILTANADGTVTIAAHDRVYPVTGTTVAVDGGSITGLSGNVTVYYMDAAREGGAVAYQATNNAVAQTGNTHIVGQVSIPALGEPPSTGSGPTAPGYTAPSNGGGEYEQLQ